MIDDFENPPAPFSQKDFWKGLLIATVVGLLSYGVLSLIGK